MFSPEASTLSLRSSQRNPRRRPRNSTEPQQQQQRRKRSKLGDETFVPISDDIIDDSLNESASVNGHADSNSTIDIPVREKKGTAKRVFQEELALYLVSTGSYHQ